MLSADTRVRGAQGWQLISDILAGGNPSKTGRKYTFGLNKGAHSKKTWTVIADRPHLWSLANGETTYDLREGDVVPANKTDCGYAPEGWLHGYMKRQGFSAGTYHLAKTSKWHGRLTQLSINKAIQKDGTDYLFPAFPYQKWPYELETIYQGAKYIGSFIQGFMDGAKPYTQVAFSTSQAAWWFYAMAPFGGYVASGVVNETRAKTEAVRGVAKEFHTIYRFYCIRGAEHQGFKLLQIEPVNKGLYLPHDLGITPEPLCIEGGLQAMF